MASVTKIDFFEGCGATISGRVIRDHTRMVIVGNCHQYQNNPAPRPANIVPNVLQALADFRSSLISGARHEEMHNLMCVGFEIEGLSGFDARVRVKYVDVEYVTITGGGRLEVVQTDKDFYGNPIKVFYEGPLDESFVVPTEDQWQAGVVTTPSFRGQFTLTRVSPKASNDPQLLAGAITNCINSDYFLGNPPGTICCTAVNFSNEGMEGVAWQISAEFSYKSFGHNPEAVWINKESGQPGVDLVATDLAGYSANGKAGRKIIPEHPLFQFGTLISPGAVFDAALIA